jgi:hypothetical protein
MNLARVFASKRYNTARIAELAKTMPSTLTD